MSRRSDAERGQALLETAISLPVILTAFFFVLWSAQSSVLQERVALAARAAGTITPYDDPVPTYRIATLYAGLAGGNPGKNTCTAAPVSGTEFSVINGYLTGGAPGISLNDDSTPPFWWPLGTSVQSCGRIDGNDAAGNPALYEVSYAVSISSVLAMPVQAANAAAASESVRTFQPNDVATAANALAGYSATIRQSLCPGGGIDAPC
jgi:hypothetical protein